MNDAHKRMNDQLKKIRKEILGPVEDAAKRMFGSEDGKKILNTLERAFGEDPIERDVNGAVDPNAVLINVGAQQVINYLRRLAESNEGQE